MANVRDKDFLLYLETFHSTYVAAVERYLEPDVARRLMRYAMLPCRIDAYVSTSRGVAYQYVAPRGDVPDGATQYNVTVGSAAAEDLMLRTPRRLLKWGAGIFYGSGAVDSLLMDVVVKGQRLLEVEAGASVRLIRVENHVDHYHARVEFAEIDGRRALEHWSEARAIERATAEVMEALADVALARKQGATLSAYMETFKSKHVLLLGDFGPKGRGRLQRFREVISGAGYVAVLIDEVEELREFDLRQKLLAVASVCRFVVVDDSSRGGHLAEMVEIDSLRATMAVLRLLGTRSSYVTRPLSHTSRVIKEEEYTLESLDSVLLSSLNWAEEMTKELAARTSETYPWREM